ncbi:MAG: hypothetical protein EZS28_018812, partial [Streblomastix strix]
MIYLKECHKKPEKNNQRRDRRQVILRNKEINPTATRNATEILEKLYPPQSAAFPNILIPSKSNLNVDASYSPDPVTKIPPPYPVGQLYIESAFASHSYIKASLVSKKLELEEILKNKSFIDLYLYLKLKDEQMIDNFSHREETEVDSLEKVKQKVNQCLKKYSFSIKMMEKYSFSTKKKEKYSFSTKKMEKYSFSTKKKEKYSFSTKKKENSVIVPNSPQEEGFITIMIQSMENELETYTEHDLNQEFFALIVHCIWIHQYKEVRIRICSILKEVGELDRKFKLNEAVFANFKLEENEQAMDSILG